MSICVSSVFHWWLRVLLPSWPAAEDNVGSRERHAGNQRRFHRQGAQILGLEVVHVALAAGAGEDLDLRSDGVQPVGDALCRGVDFEPLHEFRVLRGDADRAAAGVAVMAMIWGGANGCVIFDIKRLVAIKSN